MLARPDVQAVLAGAPFAHQPANHCLTCKCIRTLVPTAGVL